MLPLNFTEEANPNPSKADELNKHNQNLSCLLREQMFFQNQGNDYMVDKIQTHIERVIEEARNKKIIL